MKPCPPGVRTERRYLTEAERQRIIDLFTTSAAGRRPTLRAIARRVGRHHSTVQRCLRLAGWYRPQPRLSPAEKDRIIALYQGTRNGPVSTVTVGRMVGRSAWTVNQVVTEAGIKRARRRVTVISVYRWTGTRYQKLTNPTAGVDEGDVVVRQGPRRRVEVHQVPADPGPDVRPPADARSAACLRSGCAYSCAVTCARRGGVPHEDRPVGREAAAG